MTQQVSSCAAKNMSRRADTILKKAGELASIVNKAYGYESDQSNYADDVLCTAENLAAMLSALASQGKTNG